MSDSEERAKAHFAEAVKFAERGDYDLGFKQLRLGITCVQASDRNKDGEWERGEFYYSFWTAVEQHSLNAPGASVDEMEPKCLGLACKGQYVSDDDLRKEEVVMDEATKEVTEALARHDLIVRLNPLAKLIENGTGPIRSEELDFFEEMLTAALHTHIV